MLLVGDIGGTKTVIAHYDESDGSPRQIRVATFKSKDYPSLENILAAFFATMPA